MGVSRCWCPKDQLSVFSQAPPLSWLLRPSSINRDQVKREELLWRWAPRPGGALQGYTGPPEEAGVTDWPRICALTHPPGIRGPCRSALR